MSEKTYRFLLRPLDKVFFGGEKSPFINEDYYLRSHYLPQQTALLGFLRYWLLLKAGLIDEPGRKNWAKLIGERSFSGSSTQTFGAIQQLSPLRIAQLDAKDQIADDYFLGQKVGGLSAQAVNSKVKYALGDAKVEESGLALFQNNDYIFTGKKQKERGEFESMFWNLRDNFIEVSTDAKKAGDLTSGILPQAVFFKATKPGIRKHYAGEPEEDAYFKTEYYRMQRQFAYSFLAKMDEALLPENFAEPGFCRFGGDGGSVAVQVIPTEYAWDQTPGEGNCFFLLSDTLAKPELYTHCAACKIELVHFRSLNTHNGDRSFSRRPKMWYTDLEDTQHSNSGKIMLQKGSLLIAKPDHAEELQECLQNPTYFNIGYNHFIRLNQLPS